MCLKHFYCAVTVLASALLQSSQRLSHSTLVRWGLCMQHSSGKSKVDYICISVPTRLLSNYRVFLGMSREDSSSLLPTFYLFSPFLLPSLPAPLSVSDLAVSLCVKWLFLPFLNHNWAFSSLYFKKKSVFSLMIFGFVGYWRWKLPPFCSTESREPSAAFAVTQTHAVLALLSSLWWPRHMLCLPCFRSSWCSSSLSV